MTNVLKLDDMDNQMRHYSINSKILIVLMLGIFLNSCKKNIPSIEPADDGIIAVLISGTWQLTSATYFNSTGNIANKFVGAKADSVLFLYGPDQYSNIVLTNISSYIGGNNRLTGYSIATENYQKRISTILLSPAWKNGYSDSLFVTFYANTTLVFKVKDSVGNGYEIDSLKKVRGY